jgi:subfamily B ATP-binding cassette protein MsbA
VTRLDPLNRLFRYARPYRVRLVWAVAGMIVYAVGSAGLAWLVRPIFDNVLSYQQRLSFTMWAIVVVYLLKGVGSYVSSYLMADVGQRVVMDVRNALYRHILGQSAGFFAHRTTGELMSRINNDVGQVQQAVSETVGDLARESLSLVGFLALMIHYDLWLSVVCLTGAPLIVYPLIWLGQRVRRTTRRSQEALSHLSHLSAEAFTGHRIVKAFATEEHEAGKFNAAGAQLFRTNMKVTAALSSLPPLMEIVGGVCMAAALWYGSREIAAGRLTTGEFASFFTAVFLMYGPAKKLSRVNANLQQAIAASERIFEMLDTDTEVKERPGATPMTPFAHAIELRDDGDSATATLRDGSCGRVIHGARGGDGGDRRPQRRRQNDPRQPAATVLRRQHGQHSDRRRRCAAGHARVAARADRHRDAGNSPLRRYDRAQYRLRVDGRDGAAD